MKIFHLEKVLLKKKLKGREVLPGLPVSLVVGQEIVRLRDSSYK